MNYLTWLIENICLFFLKKAIKITVKTYECINPKRQRKCKNRIIGERQQK